MIQHTVMAMINGAEHTIHLVEESCHNPCRYKCSPGSAFGFFDEVTSVDSDTESLAPSNLDSPDEGTSVRFQRPGTDGEDHTGRKSTTQRSAGQTNEIEPLDNNHRSMSRKQINTVNSQITVVESDGMGSLRRIQQLTNEEWVRQDLADNN